MLAGAVTMQAQETGLRWCGSAKAELSAGVVGYAREFSYFSTGVAASYGAVFADRFFASLGVKPNYIFSDGDFNGFFLPVYGEFRYQPPLKVNQFGGYAVARAGYSPVDQRGA